MIACPYCLEQIADAASVCRYCGRDVRRLLEVEALLKQSRAELEAANAQLRAAGITTGAPVIVAATWSPNWTLFAFYVASLSTLSLVSEQWSLSLVCVLVALMSATIARKHAEPNVLSITLYAFALPAIAFPVVVVKHGSQILLEEVTELLRAAVYMAALLAVVAAATTVVYLILFRRSEMRSALRLPSYQQSLNVGERATKLVSLGISLGTALAAVGTFLMRLVP